MGDALRPPLPNFLIIGAQKSATRWLRTNLGAHPEVFTAPGEPAFFSHPERFARGPAAYRSAFAGWRGEPVVGESTPAYMIRRHDPPRVAERIDRMLPGVRLLALLRNPVDRAYSAFLHHVDRGRIPPEAELVERAGRDPDGDPLDLIAGGRYAASLSPYRRRFGDRLTVLLLDDVAADPAAAYDRALAHIGASPGFRPPRLAKVRFSLTPPARSRYAQEGGRRPLSPSERRALWSYFEDDVAQLEIMLGRSLSCWHPPPPAVGRLSGRRSSATG